MVFLQSSGPEVSNWNANQPSHEDRLLEGHWQRQGCHELRHSFAGGHEEDASFLHGTRSSRREDQLDHA